MKGFAMPGTGAIDTSPTISVDCNMPYTEYLSWYLLKVYEMANQAGIELFFDESTDISTTKDEIYDWGIIGLSWVGSSPSVVSTFRCRKNVSKSKMIRRFTQTINHELGHSLGLFHCKTKNCLMVDAKGTIKTVDRSTGRFCDECQKNIKELMEECY